MPGCRFFRHFVRPDEARCQHRPAHSAHAYIVSALLSILTACEPTRGALELAGDDTEDRLVALEEELAELRERQAAIEELQASDALALLQCQAEVDHLQERVSELETEELPERVDQLEGDVGILWTAVEALYE